MDQFEQDNDEQRGALHQGASLADPHNPGRRAAIWRALEANRANYVSAARLHELEAALMRAESEAFHLRKRLNAFETSTIWGLTRPIRRMVEVAKALRGAPDPAHDLPSPAFPPADPASDAGYQGWIDEEEPAILSALLRPSAEHTAVVSPTLGLVLWTDDADADRVAAGVTAALMQIPVACPAMVVCPAAALVAARQAAVAQDRADILVHAGSAGCDGLPLALDRLGAAYLCFHHLSDQIARQALSVVRVVLREEPQTALLFGDEDWLGPDGVRTRPLFQARLGSGTAARPGSGGTIRRLRHGGTTANRADRVGRSRLAIRPVWAHCRRGAPGPDSSCRRGAVPSRGPPTAGPCRGDGAACPSASPGRGTPSGRRADPGSPRLAACRLCAAAVRAERVNHHRHP